MMIKKKMKIVVLGGGISTEREVSLVSATNICRALRELGHKAIFVDMFFGLENYNGDLKKIFDASNGLCGDVSIEHNTPDLLEIKESRKYKSNSRIGLNVLEVCQMADCVFLGLHGRDGEDGKLQATLELLGVPFTGSDYLGSALALDKAMAKKLMKLFNIPTPEWTEYNLGVETIDSVKTKTKVPCVVKAIDGGSSIGVYICDTVIDLQNALQICEKNNNKIVIENKICGREFTVPILKDKALSVIEIIPPEGNTFDYVAKYQSGNEGAREICPANITDDEQHYLVNLALSLHRALGLKVYSRTDFILDSNGIAWCLEVNTLPGMTPNSLIPKAAKLEGLEYPQLCEKIIELSLESR